MKKLFATLLALTLSLALLLSFASCNTNENGDDTTAGNNQTSDITPDGDDTTTPPTDNTEIKVAVLNGTTGFGIAPLYCDIRDGKSGLNAKIDFYSDATLVAPLVISKSVDIAAVPTNLAAVLYNKTQGGIQVLAVNTLGVLYLVENGSTVNSLSDLEGKTVYLPGQGSNPEYVLKALLELAGIADKVTFDYTYGSPDELTTALATGKASLGVIPEPKVTSAVTKNSSLRVAIDFSKEWKTLTGTELVQGCIIARKEFVDAHPIAVENFLKEYKASVETVNSNAAEAAKLIVSAGIVANETLVTNALPRCNITYLTGEDMNSALNKFWGALFAQVPSSVGGKLPDNAIFY